MASDKLNPLSYHLNTMKQILEIRLGQQVSLTPQLQQAIRLLQLSQLELSSEIQEKLDNNIMLELEDPVCPSNPDPSLESHDCAAFQPNALISKSQAHSSKDWNNGELNYPCETDLRQHLSWQLQLSHLTEKEKLLGQIIIDVIDDNGYLEQSLEEIRQTYQNQYPHEQAPCPDMGIVLTTIQQFEPLGTAARNLQECLQIQLKNLPAEQHNPNTFHLAHLIVQNHLPLLAKQQFDKLKSKLKASLKDIQNALLLVKQLRPKPGLDFYTPKISNNIIPDLIAYKKKEHKKTTWAVTLNTPVIPKLKINVNYLGLIRKSDDSPPNLLLKEQLNEAKWFIKSLEHRHGMLLKVANAIVQEQQPFLEQGEAFMRPLLLQNIAHAVGVHESTVSRLTTQKFILTPRGTFELKYFFSGHVSQESQSDLCSTAIRAMIKRLIKGEDPKRPLSDQKLVESLNQAGIYVARRTVTKYRETMQIPASNLRKLNRSFL